MTIKSQKSCAVREKTIGILGGLGPFSTAYLFRKIMELTPAKVDQDHLRVIIDCNPKIPDRTQAILNSNKKILSLLVSTAKNLEKAGADIILIACNTAHNYLEDIQKEIGVPILNMIQLALNAVRNSSSPLENIGLLATNGTLESGIYQKYSSKGNINWIALNSSEQQSLMNLIYKIKAGSQLLNRKEEINNFLDILKEKRAQAIIIGCTELSMLTDNLKYSLPLIDPVNLLAKKAVELAKPQ